jgi:hypothetical protein
MNQLSPTIGEWADDINASSKSMDQRQKKMVLLLHMAMKAMEVKENPPTYDYYCGAIMVLKLTEFLITDKEEKPEGYVLTERDFSEWMVCVAKAVAIAVQDLKKSETVQ